MRGFSHTRVLFSCVLFFVACDTGRQPEVDSEHTDAGASERPAPEMSSIAPFCPRDEDQGPQGETYNADGDPVCSENVLHRTNDGVGRVAGEVPLGETGVELHTWFATCGTREGGYQLDAVQNGNLLISHDRTYQGPTDAIVLVSRDGGQFDPIADPSEDTLVSPRGLFRMQGSEVVAYLRSVNGVRQTRLQLLDGSYSVDLDFEGQMVQLSGDRILMGRTIQEEGVGAVRAEVAVVENGRLRRLPDIDLLAYLLRSAGEEMGERRDWTVSGSISLSEAPELRRAVVVAELFASNIDGTQIDRVIFLDYRPDIFEEREWHLRRSWPGLEHYVSKRLVRVADYGRPFMFLEVPWCARPFVDSDREPCEPGRYALHVASEDTISFDLVGHDIKVYDVRAIEDGFLILGAHKPVDARHESIDLYRLDVEGGQPADLRHVRRLAGGGWFEVDWCDLPDPVTTNAWLWSGARLEIDGDVWRAVGMVGYYDTHSSLEADGPAMQSLVRFEGTLRELFQ